MESHLLASDFVGRTNRWGLFRHREILSHFHSNWPPFNLSKFQSPKPKPIFWNFNRKTILIMISAEPLNEVTTRLPASIGENISLPSRYFARAQKNWLNQGQKPKSGLGLNDLPFDIHFQILSYLHPIFSTCLGLTCKRLYTIHRSLHSTVRTSDLWLTVEVELQQLLETWMAPKYTWSWLQERYVKSDELERSDWRCRAESRRSLVDSTFRSYQPEIMDGEVFLRERIHLDD
jgi:hypothetical protein